MKHFTSTSQDAFLSVSPFVASRCTCEYISLHNADGGSRQSVVEPRLIEYYKVASAFFKERFTGESMDEPDTRQLLLSLNNAVSG